MNKLLQGMKNTTYTENNALTNASTNDPVLDFFYHAPARRGQDNTDLFSNAFNYDITLALKAMFYIRDVRGGQGERETFRQCLRYLNIIRPDIFKVILPLVIEYGRWDDVLEFYNNSTVVDFVSFQLLQDQRSDNPSLLAKWLPSCNTSSKATRALAYNWCSALGMTLRQYRKLLVKLRGQLKVVEQQMSAGNWSEINYSHVSSRAAMIYRKAFHKRDGERYQQFIQDALSGKAKINSKTLYPYEITNKLLIKGKDDVLEALWKQLPDYAEHIKNALVVCDVSGSMLRNGFGGPRPIDVATSITLYMTERMQGFFKDHFITFSATPALEVLRGNTLCDRLYNLKNSNWGGNTDLQAVFDLILYTAIRNNVPQKEMPELLFIISDMQFDIACPDNWRTNFEVVQQKYNAAHYSIPTIVFWNVNSYITETPVTKDEKGTFLVSGCSPSILKMALNQDTSQLPSLTPYEKMMDVLNNERYSAVDLVLYEIKGC